MFKKIVSLTAAAVLAAGCAAVLPEDNGISADLKASAASVLDFNAGLFFQTNDWMYRNCIRSGEEGKDGMFPAQSIGVYGDCGFDKTESNFTDVKITGAGHYTVSMNRCAGEVTDGVIKVDRKTKEETDTTGTAWGLDADGTAFNMLGITTDLSGFEIIEDENEEGVVTVKYKGSDISFDNAKVTIGDKVYDAGTLKVKSDETDYLTLMAINIYDRPETDLLGEYTMPGEDDTISIDFDVVYTEPAAADKPAEDKPAADKPAAVKKTSIKTAKVSAIKAKSYTGKAIKPAVTVKLGKKTLKKGTDYTVTYKNNKAVGKATVTVKGKGSYTGTITKTFKINPKKSSIKK